MVGIMFGRLQVSIPLRRSLKLQINNTKIVHLFALDFFIEDLNVDQFIMTVVAPLRSGWSQATKSVRWFLKIHENLYRKNVHVLICFELSNQI